MSELTVVERQNIDGVLVDFFDAPPEPTETYDKFVSVAQAIARVIVPSDALDTVFQAVPPVEKGMVSQGLHLRKNGLSKPAKEILRSWQHILSDIVEADAERYTPPYFELQSSHISAEYSTGNNRVEGTAAQWHLDAIEQRRWRYVVSLGLNPRFSTEFLLGSYAPYQAYEIFLSDNKLPPNLTHLQSTSGTLMRFMSDRTIHRANAQEPGHRVFFSATVADHYAFD